ncbi:MAG: phosphatidate cytidylyltransferase [Deltaproteobacteria bacterium]|nr:phosphatidate cytidylyltransferase [Deltaproteobacteria bacterium]
MTRVIVALIAAVLTFCATWFLPVEGFQYLVFVVTFLSLREFSELFFPDLLERWATIASGMVVALIMLWGSVAPEFIPVALAVVLFFLALVFMKQTPELTGVMGRIGAASFALLYLGVAPALLAWLRELGEGRGWVLMMLVPACLTDTMGLVVGRLWGNRLLAPKVSPKKTWEGFWGALVGSLVGTAVVWVFFFRDAFPWWHVLGLGFLVWLVAPFGDLIESMIKRSVGVKDSSHLIPGHGGILDRIDSLILTSPFVYLYARFILGW